MTLRLKPSRALAAVLLLITYAGLTSCGAASDPMATFGGSQNHLHDLLALHGVPHTILLATHIGIYRSADEGHTWREVAAGTGQAMDRLMAYRLAQSSADPRRVYVLAIVRTSGPQKTTPGLYTSADAGQTWRLAAPLTTFPNSSVYSIGTGAAAGQVFAIDSALGAHGLYESLDAGAHWQALPALPTSAPTGVAGDPNDPNRVLLWSVADGLFVSTNGGQQWMPAQGIHNGIYSVAWAGTTGSRPSVVYAAGDAGLYRSDDAGATFTLVNGQVTYDAIAACTAMPTRAYAMTGTSVYATHDGGSTWTATGPTSNHPGGLTVDPQDPNIAYVAFSYPLGVEVTTDGGGHWHTVLP